MASPPTPSETGGAAGSGGPAQMTAPTARVKRGSTIVEVPAAEIVPGDLLHLEEGDRIAADVRLVDTASLEVQEAALTGESQTVEKEALSAIEESTPLAERRTMAFMGTQVAR